MIDPFAIQQKIPDGVTLIAVSKNQSDIKIEEALQQGFRQFGENKVQEAFLHWSQRRQHYVDLVLHLIGPLQSNKAKEAVALFDVIQTVDRPKIAAILASVMREQQKFLPCFIQVNIGNETQKSGIAVNELSEFYYYCTQELKLNIVGLMAIPPFDQEATPYFQRMKKLADELGLKKISMGMSDDYEQAIACGATHVRIGTALFGER